MPLKEQKTKSNNVHYYIITLQVIIDGGEPFICITGRNSDNEDYKPNIVKDGIKRKYHNDYPNAVQIAVVILNVEKVTKGDFIQKSNNFIQT